MSLSKLKTSSNNIDRLTKEIAKINSASEGAKSVDERFWQPTLDKSGNGMAIIRFLPVSEADGEDSLPWVRVWSHGFKGPTGKWYIENSLTTLNQKDPVSELNRTLWNATTDENSPQRKQARLQKRRLTYISNIYVISDPKNPENEGKVFLYKYGKKIFDKISEAMTPPFDENGNSIESAAYNPTNAFVPFDFWKGANFKLRVRTVDGYKNYDTSSFDSPTQLKKTDAELETIWKAQYSLKEFLTPDKFKSYEELRNKLNDVLGLNSVSEPSTRRQPSFKNESMVETDSPDVPGDEDDEELKQFKALVG